MTSILTPARGGQPIFRVNPVAKLATTLIVGVALLLSLDWVSAVVALGCELVLLFWAGVGARRFGIRALPILVAAVLAGVTIALYGRASGATHFAFLFARVTDGSLDLAAATALRILAIGLPALVLFLTVDPTDLADGLGQVLHLPARFVIGALAALRLTGLFLDDWRSLELARRARGTADRGRVRRFAGQAFALLVLSIRRGSKLATAMEARGFGASTHRTWARESRFGWPETLLVLIGLTVAAAAVTAAILAGTWRFLGGQ
ncbi:MAG: energy-coupling factor transport system permease protein [Actinomycetota bacterium]|jgi:energy-coupling factor transport system permease protein|nr:energy-coupling factor transport system permease protein [Actinomycetota bacterium]